MERTLLPRISAWLQGSYYVLTGLWPIAHMPSFLLVTGPKTDLWLVQAVGLLMIVSGATLLHVAYTNRFPAAVVILASGNALALALIDLIFVANQQISSIYLLDAIVETGFACAWVVCAWIAQHEAPAQIYEFRRRRTLHGL